MITFFGLADEMQNLKEGRPEQIFAEFCAYDDVVNETFRLPHIRCN